MITKVGFSLELATVPIRDILPARKLLARDDCGAKLTQIKDSIVEIGMIEPLSISHFSGSLGKYLLLDGHIRLSALISLGFTEATCLIALGDEAFTYNNRVNRLSAIQEHLMIKRAVARGVSPERIATVLGVNARSIALKATLLDGICLEAAKLLEGKQFTIRIAAILRNMKPTRQVECVELMNATNNFTLSYLRAMFLATPPALLLAKKSTTGIARIQPRKVGQIEKEMADVHARYKLVEESYGEKVLDLVLVRGYVAKLLANTAVNGYLVEREPEIRAELETITLATSID